MGGRRAAVTGGTRGIGRAIVEVLAEEGCRVAFCARDTERVLATEAELKTRGHDVRGGVADITDDAALKRWLDGSAERFGGIDILGRLGNPREIAQAVAYLGEPRRQLRHRHELRHRRRADQAHPLLNEREVDVLVGPAPGRYGSRTPRRNGRGTFL